MAEVKLFEVNLNETINNIKRLEEELKAIKKVYKEAAIGSEEFVKAQSAGKELTAEIKKQNDALKANTNALGGINSAAKFAEGSYGRLKQQIKENRDALDKVNIGGKVYKTLIEEQTRLTQKRIDIEKQLPSLFQERIKGAIQEASTIQELKEQIREYTAAVIRGEEGAAEKLAELKDKLEDVQDATTAFKGTGVERLTQSMNLLRDSITNVDLDKFKLSIQGLSASMKAIPLLLVIDILARLIDKLQIADKITSLFENTFSSLSETTVLNKEALDSYNQTLDESSKSVTDLINQLGKLQIQQLGTSKVLKEDQVKSLQSIDELFNELDKVEEKRRETSKKIILSTFKDKLKDLQEQGASEVQQLEYLREQKLVQLNAEGSDIIATRTAFGKESLSIEEKAIRNLLVATNKGFDEQRKALEDSYNVQTKIVYDEDKKQKEEESKKANEKLTKKKKDFSDEIAALEASIIQKKNLNESALTEEIALEKFKLKIVLKDIEKGNGEKLKAQAEYIQKVNEFTKQEIERNQKEELTLLEAQIKERQNLNEKGFNEQQKLIEYQYEVAKQTANGNYEELYKAQVDFDAAMIELQKNQKEEEERINKEYFEKDLNARKLQQEIIINEEQAFQEVNFEDAVNTLETQFEAKQNLLLLQREQELYGLDEHSLKYQEIISRYNLQEIELERQKQDEKAKLRQAEVQSVANTMQVIMNLGALLAKDQEKQGAFAKMAALINIAANTGLAISNLTATSFSPLSPDNVATGGIAAYAKLAAGLVTITSNMVQAKQLINSFEEGGYTGEGNPHEVSTNLGSKSYTYHKDEYVVPSRVLNTSKGSALAGQLENMRLGMSNPMPHISGMFDGGFTGRSAGMETSNMLSNQIMMQKFIESMPNPVVRVTDINKTQNSVQRAVNVSSL
jgi:hypothetical protein